MASTSVRPEFARASQVPPAPRVAFWQRYLTPTLFLGPALVFLTVWIVYPAGYTVVRSFWNDTGNKFVWFDNYRDMFTDDLILRAIRNNALWVAVVPAAVTAIGLVFAVLTERVR